MVRTWPEPSGELERVILWPKVKETSDIPHQREVIRDCLQDIYRDGGWCVYLDEARYITDYLGLGRLVELLWLQGRSNNITVVASAQRPRHLPLAAYSQASHLYLWPTRDMQDLRRVQEMAGGPSLPEVKAAMAGLPEHACLYLGQDGTMVGTKVVASKGG